MDYKRVWTIIAGLAVLTTGCSYGSMYEARAACDEWKEQGKEITYSQTHIKSRWVDRYWEGASQEKIDNTTSEKRRAWLIGLRQYTKEQGNTIRDEEITEYVEEESFFNRSCLHEEETEKFLGTTKSIINQKDLYDWTESPEYARKITKRFQY